MRKRGRQSIRRYVSGIRVRMVRIEGLLESINDVLDKDEETQKAKNHTQKRSKRGRFEKK